jgi:hypothetical protein
MQVGGKGWTAHEEETIAAELKAVLTPAVKVGAAR